MALHHETAVQVRQGSQTFWVVQVNPSPVGGGDPQPASACDKLY